MKKENKLLTAPINKTIIFLAFPITFAMMLQIIYTMVDTFWVGRLGADAVAAVSLSFPIIFLLTSAGMGLAMAGTILVSQHKGRGEREKVNKISSQTFSLVLMISLILGLIGFFFSKYLVILLGASPIVTPQAINYLKISFLGLIFMFSYVTYQSLMRGIGEVKIPLYIVLGTVILNFFIDPLFINGYGIIPAWGVSGAAIATIMSQGLASIIGFAILFSGKFEIHLNLKHFKPELKLFKKIILLGLPASIERSLTPTGMLVMTFIASGFGTIAIASFGLGTRILSLIILSAVGLSIAMSTLIGQHIGAEKIERAGKISKSGVWFSFLIPTILGILLFIFAKPIAHFFVPNETELINSVVQFIRIMSPTFGFLGINMVVMGIFRGAGKTSSAMTLSFVHTITMIIGAIILSQTSLATSGIWYSYPIANVIAASTALIWLSTGTWKTKRIIQEKTIESKIDSESIREMGRN